MLVGPLTTQLGELSVTVCGVSVAVAQKHPRVIRWNARPIRKVVELLLLFGTVVLQIVSFVYRTCKYSLLIPQESGVCMVVVRIKGAGMPTCIWHGHRNSALYVCGY